MLRPRGRSIRTLGLTILTVLIAKFTKVLFTSTHFFSELIVAVPLTISSPITVAVAEKVPLADGLIPHAEAEARHFPATESPGFGSVMMADMLISGFSSAPPKDTFVKLEISIPARPSESRVAL